MDACDTQIGEVAALSIIVTEARAKTPIATVKKVTPSIDAGRIVPRPRESDEERDDRQKSIQNAKRWQTWEELVDERGSRYRDCRLNTFEAKGEEQKSVVNRLKSYLDDMPERVKRGEGILLFGPKGCGKDHLLMAYARVAIGHDFNVRWINGMDLFARLRCAMDAESSESENIILHEIRKPSILWLSGPAPPTGTLSEYQQSFLFRLLDYRYSHLLPTWVTCNVTSGAELDARIGAQNGDRLRHGALALFTSWASYRQVSA